MKKPKSVKFIKVLVVFIVIAVIALAGYRIYSRRAARASAQSTSQGAVAMVTKGDIAVKITGAGTLEPALSYDITPTAKGNVLNSPFEVGSIVKRGDLLFQIDDSDLQNTIEKTKNDIQKAELNNQLTDESIAGLTVYAPCDGRIENMDIAVGDEAGGNIKISDIINDKQLTAVVPFNYSQIQKIKTGQKAEIVIPQFMTSIAGTVKSVSRTAKPASDGTAAYDVEISSANPGAVVEGTKVNAVIYADGDELSSPQTGVVNYEDNRSVTAETSGKVKKIYVNNGEWVASGQKLVELENKNLTVSQANNDFSIKELQLTLENYENQLNDYNILSPIDGTVIVKNYKTGDTVNASNGNVVLMTVADLDNMKFTIDIDELDIAKIEAGQKVSITADALPDENFEGEVTSIPVLGKAQNGVTTYPVEVTMKNKGKLKPGMNVTAEIIVASKTNVLRVPMAAVTKVNGKTYVKLARQNENTNGKKNNNNTQNQSNQDQSQSINRRQFTDITGGTPKEVKVGINNENYIEIMSGLSEGDFVILPNISNQNSNSSNIGVSGFSGGMRIPGTSNNSGNRRFGGN